MQAPSWRFVRAPRVRLHVPRMPRESLVLALAPGARAPNLPHIGAQPHVPCDQKASGRRALALECAADWVLDHSVLWRVAKEATNQRVLRGEIAGRTKQLRGWGGRSQEVFRSEATMQESAAGPRWTALQ
eukprot:475939-Prymnesium_polylepis.1